MSNKNTGISAEVEFTSEEVKQEFLQHQVELLREIKVGLKTWNDLCEYRKAFGFPEVSVETLRRNFQQLGVYDEEGWITPLYDLITPIPAAKESTAIDYEKGETTSTRNLVMTSDQINNPDELLRLHGFDPNNWTLKSANNSRLERYGATADTYSYSSRILVKPKTGREITLNDVDEYFDKFNGKKYTPLKIKPTQYDPNGEFLEVCLQDVHMGLLSYEPETGEDYDCYIAKARVEKLIGDVVQRSKGRKFKRIVFALLGDILHVDNVEGTTTKGTRQDTDSRTSKLFDFALDMLINCVDNLGSIAPVEIINCPGNHDNLCSYMLCRALEMAYRDDKNVTFFNSPNPRKWRRYGNVLIGFGHGEMKSNAASEWLTNEASEDWGKSKFHEIHLGHIHSLKTLQKIEENNYGLITRYLPCVCSSSAWEHNSGFPKSLRSLVCFVWNEDSGLREMWYNNI